jgi:hypothetical protein
LEVSFRHPRPNGIASLLGQLKLNWPPGLALNNHGALGHAGALGDIAHPQAYQIATAQLAVDRQIE